MKNTFAKTIWDENGNLVSEHFGDVYFSLVNGYEETKYVFLKGNNLPEAFSDKKHITIAETGFGTGLNFLTTWKIWDGLETKPNLHFISTEKFPLDIKTYKESLKEFPEVAPFKEKLNAVYPQLITTNKNTLEIEEGLTLTLLIGDVNETLSKENFKADAWYLDGFSPAKNPEMWNQNLYNNMARLSKNGATLATFTAAGHVRNGLTQAGFNVERIKGFAYKRHMTVGKKA